LALGTAQFGLAYGINNTAGRPDDATVWEILETARAAGIHLLDTATGYGDSESRLGEWLGQPGGPTAPMEVVTKLAAAPAAQVKQQVQASLARLGLPAVHGVLFHQFAAFRQSPGAWEALRDARAAGQVRRIGVSLYHPHEAEWLLDQGLDVDLVQVPFNVLDQRFAAVLPRLQQRGVEVHVRSAFLQGLLLRAPDALPPFFAALKPKISELRRLAAAAGLPLPALLLLFPAFTPGVDRVVVGVDSAANLRENLSAADFISQAEQLRPLLQDLAEETDQFILPYTWPPRS
jgi:aryl-alcohol dehydrogenase-like predicted oxidoreductase